MLENVPTSSDPVERHAENQVSKLHLQPAVFAGLTDTCLFGGDFLAWPASSAIRSTTAVRQAAEACFVDVQPPHFDCLWTYTAAVKREILQ